MINIDPSMTNGKLKQILKKEYGMKAPVSANKTKLLELLAENGATISGATPEPTSKVGKKNKYKLMILSTKDEKGPVPVGINGRVTLIQRDKEVIVNESIYLVLTQYAKRIVGEPMENGQGLRTHLQPAYPVSVLEIIPG